MAVEATDSRVSKVTDSAARLAAAKNMAGNTNLRMTKAGACDAEFLGKLSLKSRVSGQIYES
jgi:Flp pilus assembly protein TadG